MGKLPATNTSVDDDDLLRVKDQTNITTDASGIGGYPLSGTPVVGGTWVFNGTEMVSSGVTSTNSISSYTVTVGSGVTADYNSVGAAVTAGKTDVLVIANTLESGNPILPSNFTMRFTNNSVVNLQGNRFSLTEPASLYIEGPGVIRAQYGSALSMFNGTSLGSSLTINNLRLQVVSNGYIADCQQTFNNVSILLPNANTSVLRPADSRINRYVNITFSGGGTSCQGFIKGDSSSDTRIFYVNMYLIGTFANNAPFFSDTTYLASTSIDGLFNDASIGGNGLLMTLRTMRLANTRLFGSVAGNVGSSTSPIVDSASLSPLNIVNGSIFTNCAIGTLSSTHGSAGLGGNKFVGCSITTWGLGGNYEVGDSEFSNCSFLSSIPIPGILSVGGASFNGCDFSDVTTTYVGGSGILFNGCNFNNLVFLNTSTNCALVGCRLNALTDLGVNNVSGVNIEY